MLMAIRRAKLFMQATITLLFMAAVAGAQFEVPQPRGFVNDIANRLSPATAQDLERQLKDFGERSGIDFKIVTVPFAYLRDHSIEEYTRTLGKQWRVGRGPDSLGLVLLIAIKEKNADGSYGGGTRLEVSRKLETDMPNELAGNLIRGMRDDLKAGRFDNALRKGAGDIMMAIAQKRGISYNPSAPAQNPQAYRPGSPG